MQPPSEEQDLLPHPPLHMVPVSFPKSGSFIPSSSLGFWKMMGNSHTTTYFLEQSWPKGALALQQSRGPAFLRVPTIVTLDSSASSNYAPVKFSINTHMSQGQTAMLVVRDSAQTHNEEGVLSWTASWLVVHLPFFLGVNMLHCYAGSHLPYFLPLLRLA